MRTIFSIAFILVLSLSTSVDSQILETLENSIDRYQKIDDYADHAPSAKFTSPAALAAYLVLPAKNDYEKARVIYRWVSNSIKYDAESYFSGKFLPADASSVLTTGKSVCEGYANLFDLLAREAGLETVKISGHAKGYGYSPNTDIGDQSNHAWNAVKIEGVWRLVDTTWGSGYLDGRTFVKRFDSHYFLTPPDQFIYDHFPENQKWQLLANPVTKIQYADLPRLRTDFFKYQLRLMNQTAGSIQTTGEFNLIIGSTAQSGKMNAAIISSLYQDGKILDARHVFIQRQDNHIHILVRLPQKGEYLMQIFAKPRNEKGPYISVADFHVLSKAGTPSVFPGAYEIADKDILLEKPLEGILKAGDEYEFSIKAPGVNKAAIISGDEWIFLDPVTNGFKRKVIVPRGTFTLFVNYPDESNFRGIYTYTGK